MDFRGMVNKELRTPEQIAREKAQAEEMERFARCNNAAVCIYEIIKNRILYDARNGSANHSIITGIVPITFGDTYGTDDSAPYGNIFKVKTQTGGGRSVGLFGFSYKDTSKQSVSVQDMATLRAVFDLVKQYCDKDGIKISEPFILCKIVEWNNFKNVKEVKRFLIRNNTLSASVTTMKRGSGSSWHGEYAILSLGVDYSFSL